MDRRVRYPQGREAALLLGAFAALPLVGLALYPSTWLDAVLLVVLFPCVALALWVEWS